MDLSESKLIGYIMLAVNYYVFYSVLTRRRSLLQQIAAFIITIILIKAFTPPLYNFIGTMKLTLFLIGTLFCIPVFYIFREHWTTKLFVFFIVAAVSQYVALIFSFVTDYIYHYFSPNAPSISLYILAAVLEIALLLFIYRNILNTIKYILKSLNKENFVMSLLPLSACIILSVIHTKDVFDLYTLTITIAITFIFIVTFYLFDLSIQLKNRKNNLENQLLLQMDHYRDLTQSIQKNRIYRHDIRHHLAGIAELIEKQDMAATQSYLDSLNEQYTESQAIVFCENKYIDAVLAHYFKIAQQQSIQVTIQLYVPEETGIESLDLCVIIGNCFEKAIALCCAVKRTDKRRISIEGKIVRGCAAIALSGSYSREPKRLLIRFNVLIQPDQQEIGLESIRLLAKKYNGDIRISADQKQGIFTTTISLKVPQLPKNEAEE